MTNPNPLIRVTVIYSEALAKRGCSLSDQRAIFGDGKPYIVRVCDIHHVEPAIKGNFFVVQMLEAGKPNWDIAITITESLDEIEARIERAVFGPKEDAEANRRGGVQPGDIQRASETQEVEVR